MMKNKLVLFSCFIAAMCNAVIAQDGYTPPTQELLKMPVAPTPDASALGKFGDIPVGLSTGIPSIDIPFYKYQDQFNKLGLAVGVSYHAGGHKVEDMASSVGLGWSLYGTGLVTRSVNGLPDDQFGGYLNTDTLPVLYTQTDPYFSYVSGVSSTIGTHIAVTRDEDITNWFRIKEIQERIKDGEPDLFSFNVAGLSGKFIIQKNKQVKLFTLANVAVTFDTTMIGSTITSISSFTVLDKNTGISYLFDVHEQLNPSTNTLLPSFSVGSNALVPAYISGWYLSKIISADKRSEIRFTYTDAQFEYESGFSESQTAELQSSLSPGLLTPKERQWSYSLIQSNAKHIQKIELPDSTKIVFKYGFPRADLVGDSALIGVEINNGAETIKYALSFDYFITPDCTTSGGTCPIPASSNDFYKRLKLCKIQQTNGTDTLPPYKFDYNETPLPVRNSRSIDYWGYYKGGNSLCLIPEFDFEGFPPYYFVLGCSNREPEETYMKACNLEKLTYPTGGYTKFYYEINKAFGEDYNVHVLNEKLQLNEEDYDTNSELAFDQRNDTNVVFFIKLAIDTSSGGGPSSPLGCNFDYIITSTDNLFTTTITATIEQFMGGFADTISLPLNKQYQIKYTSECEGLADTYEIDLYYTYNIDPRDKPIGGLRVQKTEDFDSITSTPILNKYTYAGSDGYSSGEYQHLPNYHYYYSSLYEWAVDEYGMPLPYGFSRWYIHRTSSPTQSLSYFRGSPVIYKRVLVKKEFNGANNGYTIHNFSTFASTNILTQDYPFVQKQDLEWRQGLPISDSVFTSDSSLVKTTHNTYTFYEDTDQSNLGRGLLTCMIQDDSQNTMANLVYGARSYYYTSGKSELKKSIQKSYADNDSIETFTNYFYDPATYLLTVQQTVTSKGDTLEDRTYYPFHYNSTGLPVDVAEYNGEAEMVSQETWIKRNSQWYLKNARANHYDVFDNVVRLKKVGTTEISALLTQSAVGSFNPSLLTRHSSYKDQIEVLNYDAQGRHIEVQNKNDYKTTFLWEPFINSPVAQIVNAEISAVAYTSFETSNKGNWTYTGSRLMDVSGPTGKMSYDLSSGAITKSGLTSGKHYMITYWRKDGSGTPLLNSASGASKSTRNGWTLYQHVVTGVTSLSLSGSGMIDELRLHPTDAMMTTYTYKSLVGMTSQTDPNNRTVYYDYDSFNRLSFVRDQDGKVLKKICYNYAGQAENCNNVTANWQATGRTRCKPCSTNSSYTTNIAQIEQQDANPNSSTYIQTQWVDNGTSGSCGLASWQNEGSVYCQLDAYSQNTGNQVQLQRDMNPCSPTYNQTQVIVVGYNTGSCPLPPSCNFGNCTSVGPDKRCVGGVCETGVKVYTASFYNSSTGLYECTYHYEWSDSVWSSDMVEYNIGDCPIW
jgi:YD repeat-containing protein